MNALRSVIRRAALSALGAAFACAPTGDVRVLADSTLAPGAVEVAALREDPRSAALRVADSLDGAFQVERALLNARAESLAATDRRTTAYAVAYDQYAVRAAAAERLRRTRDSARRAAEPPALPSMELGTATRARLVNAAANLRLRPGEWWIVRLDSAGGVITAERVTVRAAHEVIVRKSTVNSE